MYRGSDRSDRGNKAKEKQSDLRERRRSRDRTSRLSSCDNGNRASEGSLETSVKRKRDEWKHERYPLSRLD